MDYLSRAVSDTDNRGIFYGGNNRDMKKDYVLLRYIIFNHVR